MFLTFDLVMSVGCSETYPMTGAKEHIYAFDKSLTAERMKIGVFSQSRKIAFTTGFTPLFTSFFFLFRVRHNVKPMLFQYCFNTTIVAN